MPRTSVYAVNKTSISLASSVAVASQPSTSSNASSVPCTGKTAVFTQSSPLHLAPNLIFSASYPADASSAGCGAVLQANASTSGRQTAAPALATWRYAAGSGIHGMAAHAGAGTGSSSGSGQAVAEVTLYSADLGTDSLWTHRFVRPSSTAGVDVQVTELGHTRMETTTADGRTMHPRHLAVHPNGRVLYAIMEADNSLVAFDLDAQGVPVVPAGGIKDIWDLLPDGEHASHGSKPCPF